MLVYSSTSDVTDNLWTKSKRSTKDIEDILFNETNKQKDILFNESQNRKKNSYELF